MLPVFFLGRIILLGTSGVMQPGEVRGGGDCLLLFRGVLGQDLGDGFWFKPLLWLNRSWSASFKDPEEGAKDDLYKKQLHGV